MATLQDVDWIVGELPEVAEGEHHGHTTWSVRDKGIAWLRPFSKADLERFGDQTPPTATGRISPRPGLTQNPRSCTVLPPWLEPDFAVVRV